MTDERKPFRREGLGYVYEPVDENGMPRGVSLRVDSIHGSGERMVGEIVVQTTLAGLNTHLLMATQNLTGPTARTSLAKHLAGRTNGARLPWDDIVEEFCVAVLLAEREGTPFMKIGALDDTEVPPDLIDHIVQQGRTNDIHGPMGDGKGYLASFMVVCHVSGLTLAHLKCNATGQVLYLDWEDDYPTLNRRLRAIAAGYGIPPVEIHYRECHMPLRDQVLQVARYVASEHITFIVVDSVELACGVGLGDKTYEERAHGLHDALRSIMTSVPWPVSVLLIDHVSDEVRTSKKGVGKAYGSVMKMAWVRNAWEVRKDQEQDSPLATIALSRYKGNHAGNVAPIGIELDFTKFPAALVARRGDIRDSETLSGRLPATSQILNALQLRPMDTKDLAEVTGLGRDALRVALNRLKKRGSVTQGTDGRWGRRSLSEPFGGASVPEEPPDLEEEFFK